MSSPCPGMDYIENAKPSVVETPSPRYPRQYDESYPGHNAGRDHGDESEYAGGLGEGTYKAPEVPVDFRTVPPQPIEDMTAREFLHFYSRNPNGPASKLRVLGGVITASDANYQAFIDIVALHMLDPRSSFMFDVLESGAKTLNGAQRSFVNDLLFSGSGR